MPTRTVKSTKARVKTTTRTRRKATTAKSTRKSLKSALLKRKLFKKRIHKIYFGAALAIVGAAAVYIATLNFQANVLAETVVKTLEAETFSWDPAANAQITTDSSASNSKVIRLNANTTGHISTTIGGSANEIGITARGGQCFGSPNMAVKLDGKLISNQAVGSTSLTKYTIPASMAAGAHTIDLSFTNQHSTVLFWVWTICSSSLTIDKVDVSVVVPTPSPSQSPSASPSSSPTASPSASPSPSSQPSTDQGGSSTTGTVTKRDPLKWPFASNSIWNMPIGTGAQFVAANLPANPGSDEWTPTPATDDERIVLRPTAPMTQIRYSSAGWSGANRCSSSGKVLTSVPIPTNYTVPNTNSNEGGVFLMPDSRTLIQTQPLARCTAGSYATSLGIVSPVDLYGTGATGAHGGSGLSSIGGSIRVGELRPGQTGMRHALKLNVGGAAALFRCTKDSDCYRWPAVTADSYAVGRYGTASNATNKQNSAMKMGALLAIPSSVNINAIGLESVPGKQIAWTLQNYGAYIVDDAWGPSYDLSVEEGADGSVSSQFKADYGYALAQRVIDNTSWSRDIQRIVQRLSVVNNNSASSIGGGGTPLQPLAPEIHP